MVCSWNEWQRKRVRWSGGSLSFWGTKTFPFLTRDHENWDHEQRGNPLMSVLTRPVSLQPAGTAIGRFIRAKAYAADDYGSALALAAGMGAFCAIHAPATPAPVSTGTVVLGGTRCIRPSSAPRMESPRMIVSASLARPACANGPAHVTSLVLPAGTTALRLSSRPSRTCGISRHVWLPSRDIDDDVTSLIQ